MKRKITLFMVLVCCNFLLVGCGRDYDLIEVVNKSVTVFDNIHIETPIGYFYDRHEKNVIDDNTVAITIYFSNEEDGEWEVNN